MTHDAAAPATPTVASALPADETPVATLHAEAEAPNTTSLPIGVAEPRTRWAGIIWGLVLASIAGFGIWFILSGVGIDGLVPWIMTFTPITLGIYIVLGFAAVAVVTALVVLIRHAQKTFAARRARV